MKYLSLISNFGGLNTAPASINASQNTFTVLDDFMYWYAERNERSFKGLVKVPSENIDLTYSNDGVSRGLFQFFYNLGVDASSYIMSARTNAGQTKVNFAYGTNLLTDLSSNIIASENYHATFCQKYDEFRGTSTAYIANGNSLLKWFKGLSQDAISCPMQDVSGTPIDITGTVTFNATTLVTNSGTWPATLQKGSWIRLNSASPWEEVDYIANTQNLYLRVASDNNTTSTSAQHSAEATVKPFFIDIWKEKLWGFNLSASSSSGSRVGTAQVDISTLGFASTGLSNALICTETYSSATPYAFEDFSGDNSAQINVGAYGFGVGMANIGDYKICFKENEYVVYRYNDTLLPPIEPVKTFQYSCVSQEAIQNVGDMIIYFTGKEVRATNGFQDVLLSADIDFDLRQRYYANNANDFYSLTTNDNALPTSVWDKTNNHYILFLTPRTPENSWDYDYTKRIGFIYDINAKQWIGKFVSYPIGHAISYFNDGEGRVEYLYSVASTYSKYLSQHTGFNTANVGVIEPSDNRFESSQYIKQIKWLDIWVHQEAGDDTDYTELSLNYFLDGVKALNNGVAQNVYPTINTMVSQTDAVQITKLRYNLNGNCRFFRYQLKDTAHYGDDKCFAILDAVLAYTDSENN